MDELCEKFAPAIIRSDRGEDDPQVEKDKKVVKSIVEFMIKRFPLIYPEEGDGNAFVRFLFVEFLRFTEEEASSLNPLMKIAQGSSEDSEKARGCLRSDFRFMKTKLHLPAYTLKKLIEGTTDYRSEAAPVNHEKGISFLV